MLRRTLLRGALAAIPLSFLWRPRGASAEIFGDYGPLIADPEEIFDLPAGFSYRVISRRGDMMSDGYRTPGKPDGMACFAGPAGSGTIVLMRNHELSNNDGAIGAVASGQSPPPNRYDSASHGGVTRVVMDAQTLEVRSANLVLYGTIRNCGGGPSPWGWLSCEEDVSTQNHGFVYACSTTADGNRAAVRLDGYGRMNHEAVAIDPTTFIAYLTEDRPDGCLYRFVPAATATPWLGKLQAMRIVGHDRLNTGTGHDVGDSWEIGWVDLITPTPPNDNLRVTARDRGAATFVRGEGCWFHGGSMYFTCTTGGPVQGGQIFRLDPHGDGGTLTLLAQSVDRAELDMPDNLTVAPWGEVFVSEDGVGEQCIRVLGENGTVSDFARNALSGGELAGVCFSPDGRVLFVNLQSDGLTLAVTGPFPEMPAPPEPDPDADPGVSADDVMPPMVAGYPGDGPADAATGGCSTGGGSTALAGAVIAGAISLVPRTPRCE